MSYRGASEWARPGSSNFHLRQRWMKSANSCRESQRCLLKARMELSTVGILWERVCFAPDQERPIRHHTPPEQRRVDGVERFIDLKAERRELIRGQHRGLQRYRHHSLG